MRPLRKWARELTKEEMLMLAAALQHGWPTNPDPRVVRGPRGVEVAAWLLLEIQDALDWHEEQLQEFMRKESSDAEAR